MISRIVDGGSVLTAFKSIGLKKDDVIFISSDMNTMAKKCKGENERLDINAIIETLQNEVSEGTIIVPAYTDHLLDGDTFDWKRARPTTGSFSNKVQRRKDFVRTKDPLHSVFVWGKHTDQILEFQDDSTFGENSIFHFLRVKNAKFIFIDIHIQDCFTYIHYVEEQNKVNYRKYYEYNINCNYPEGQKTRKVKFYSKKLGVASDIRLLHEVLVQKDVYKRFAFRDSEIDILKAEDVWEYASKSIKQGPYLYTFSLVKYLKDFYKRYVLRRKGIF